MEGGEEIKITLLLSLFLILILPITSASDLHATIRDENNNPIPGATITYQNGNAISDNNGYATLTGITSNLTWQFTIIKDNYNPLKFLLKLNNETEYKTFTISKISPSLDPTPLPTLTPPSLDINIRIHVTDQNGKPIKLATVQVGTVQHQTNIYGDTDFQQPKGTTSIEVTISKEKYTGITNTYTIPETLINDDYRLEIQIAETNPATPPIIDFTKLNNPLTTKGDTPSSQTPANPNYQEQDGTGTQDKPVNPKNILISIAFIITGTIVYRKGGN